MSVACCLQFATLLMFVLCVCVFFFATDVLKLYAKALRLLGLLPYHRLK